MGQSYVFDRSFAQVVSVTRKTRSRIRNRKATLSLHNSSQKFSDHCLLCVVLSRLPNILRSANSKKVNNSI